MGFMGRREKHERVNEKEGRLSSNPRPASSAILIPLTPDGPAARNHARMGTLYYGDNLDILTGSLYLHCDPDIFIVKK